MDKFLTLSKDDQNLLIANTARKLNMSEAIIEKDFWVCFMLNYLFSKFKYKNFICFKGGTSLSKGYSCIERFSEDIDLAIDWMLIGINKDDAYVNRSNTKQDLYNKEINQSTEIYLKENWLPIIREELKECLLDEFDLYIEDTDPQTICFKYPRLYHDSSILQVIRLEIGVLAEPFPTNFKSIKSYVLETYPEVLDDEGIKIKIVDINRTFYEKVTILHREANRINENYPKRYSRHYYDIYQMITKDIASIALKNIEILEKVVEFKKKFYPSNWAMYDEVLAGNCKLVPNNKAIAIFERDYELMKGMIYGDCPEFQQIIAALSILEKELNQVIKSDK